MPLYDLFVFDLWFAAEDNPRNDYPDEISLEEEGEEVESKASDQSEEGSNKSSEVGHVRCNG